MSRRKWPARYDAQTLDRYEAEEREAAGLCRVEEKAYVEEIIAHYVYRRSEDERAIYGTSDRLRGRAV